jgi:hypothetical protein
MKAVDKLSFANALKAAGHDTSFLDVEVAASAEPTPAKGSAAAARKSGAMAGR